MKVPSGSCSTINGTSDPSGSVGSAVSALQGTVTSSCQMSGHSPSNFGYRGCPPPCDGIVSLAVNGSPVSPVIENGYAVIARTWKAGDRIELELPMRAQRVKASDKITANLGRIALRSAPSGPASAAAVQ